MVVKVPPGEQHRRDDNGAGRAEGNQREDPFDEAAGERRRDGDDTQHEDAVCALALGRVRRAVEPPVEMADQPADEDDRVRNALPEEGGVARQCVDRHGDGEQEKMVGKGQGVVRLVARWVCSASLSRAAGSDGPPQTVSRCGRISRFAGG